MPNSKVTFRKLKKEPQQSALDLTSSSFTHVWYDKMKCLTLTCEQRRFDN